MHILVGNNQSIRLSRRLCSRLPRTCTRHSLPRAGESPESLAASHANSNKQQFKEFVATTIAQRLEPIRNEIARLRKDR